MKNYRNTSNNLSSVTSSDQDAWAEGYPDCGSFYQSPIALVSAANYAGQPTDPAKLGFEGFDVTPSSMAIENNGLGAVVLWTDETREPPSLLMNQGMRYSFEQFHFHFGSNNGVGSEHTLDGKRSARKNVNSNNHSRSQISIGSYSFRKPKPFIVSLFDVNTQ